MTTTNTVSIWGDSIGKSVTFDESRNRHVICRDNYESVFRENGYAVHNHARMGCTSVMGEKLMTPERLNGGLAVIEFGGNDSDINWKAVDSEPEKEEHPAAVSIADFKAALGRMIERVRKSGMRPMLVTPLPVAAERYLNWVSRGLSKERILRYLGSAEFIYRWQERYDIALMEVAARLGVPIFDIRSMFLNHRNLNDLMSIDGIHPNERGYAIIKQAVRKRLAEEF